MRHPSVLLLVRCFSTSSIRSSIICSLSSYVGFAITHCRVSTCCTNQKAKRFTHRTVLQSHPTRHVFFNDFWGITWREAMPLAGFWLILMLKQQGVPSPQTATWQPCYPPAQLLSGSSKMGGSSSTRFRSLASSSPLFHDRFNKNCESDNALWLLFAKVVTAYTVRAQQGKSQLKHLRQGGSRGGMSVGGGIRARESRRLFVKFNEVRDRTSFSHNHKSGEEL